VLRPRVILLTRREALNALLSTTSVDAFVAELHQRDIDMLTLDASSTGLRPWNVLSTLTNAMLVRGVPSQTVILLLVLPFIATILAFLKQVVGITTFGLYTPSIIALSFLALGWQMGVVFLVAILLVGYAARRIMRGWRMLYVPKVAIMLTVVSVALLVLMSAGAMLGMTFTRETIFLLLIMSTLAESFLNLKTEQGMVSALIAVAETVLAALLCVFLVQWGPFQSLLLAYPELLVLTVIANVLLGRWTGLRLFEYFRFRDVFRNLQEE
jgi:7 transmembrane helices usually fused to an inactive transglutaminase